MIRIVTDTSALYNQKEGKEIGVDVMPLQVTIQDKHYREFEEIDAKTFYDLIKAGNVPSSSQPAVGEFMEYFESHKEDEILVLCMADGLSGTYASTMGAKDSVQPNDNIHILNTQTLCGPHRYLVQLAVKMRDEGKSLEEIIAVLESHIDTNISFLLPQDFDFLRRGGRCTAVAAKLGGLFKLQPVVMQTKDGRQLEKFTMGRSFDIAIKSIINYLKEHNIDETFKIFVSHGFAEKQALTVVDKIKATISNVDVEVHLLSCAFLTQGGPNCIAIQAMIK